MFVGFNLCAVEAQEVLIFVDYSVLFNELDLFKKNIIMLCTRHLHIERIAGTYAFSYTVCKVIKK